jgi:c-di-GMP-binding flagellar brake protein YcgR
MVPDTQPAVLADDGHPDAWAAFRVDDGGEALRLLKQLRDSAATVHLSAPLGAALSTQLWSLDPEREQLNFCADELDPQFQRLALCDEVVAVAYLESVKLQFELHQMLLVRGPDSCVLRTAWPHPLYRFQRRAAYRVRTPERHAPKALLRHPAIPDMQLTLRIIDVSAGGIALSLPEDVPALQPGVRLNGVRIELDADTGFVATLQLQHVSLLQPGASARRLGCTMLELNGAAHRALQRYIDRTQQRRRLLAAR